VNSRGVLVKYIIPKISIMDGLGVIFVVPALASFSQAHPRLQIQLKSPSNYKSLREIQTDIMIGFSPETSADLTSIRLGSLHLMPFASSAYIQRLGVPDRENLADHEFVNTEIFASQNDIWKPWHAAIAQGKVTHTAEGSITYAMMVKAGLGIGLLANYNALEPHATPINLGVSISLPLYLVGVTERLQSKPVQIVASFLGHLFGTENPWFAERPIFEVEDDRFTYGYNMLFNLGAHRT